MKNFIALAWSLVLVFVLDIWAWAPQVPDEGKDQPAMTVSGRVTKVDEASLTIETKGKEGGTAETITLTLNQSTQKPANLTIGSQVTVEYKMEAGQRIASRITVQSGGPPPS